MGAIPRASGVMLAEGVKAGLAATGHDVIDLGVVSTPVTQHAIRRLGGVGGISIGASHNAAEWNALKFLGRNGTYLSTAEASELLDIYHLRRFRFVDYRGIGNVRIEPGASMRILRKSRERMILSGCGGSRSSWIAATAHRACSYGA